MAKPDVPPPREHTRPPTVADSKRFSGYVSEWVAFSMERLNEKYGHVLSAWTETQIRSANDLPVDQGTKVSDFINWTGGALETTARIGLHIVHSEARIQLSNRYRGPGRNDDLQIGDLHSHCLRDHVVAIVDSPEQVLVVGLGRLSSTWSGQRYYRHHNLVFYTPIHQLFNACQAGNTRFGYIQTNTDLTVCRFFIRADSEPGVHLKVIPWKNCGDKMTTDLAVWWLTMDAAEGRE